MKESEFSLIYHIIYNRQHRYYIKGRKRYSYPNPANDMKRRLFATFCFLACLHAIYAQSSHSSSLHLHRTRSGHYAFSTLLNGKVLTSVMIESGIHAALVDSAFLFSHLDELDIEVHHNDMNKEINLGGTVYRISHLAKGMLHFGNATYDGRILVLANYRDETEMTIPIHRLRHTFDWDSRIVMLDLEGGHMRMLTRKELRVWQGTRHKINRRSYERMPAVKTHIAFNIDGETTVIEGNFNIDLGNPMLLYLREQSPTVGQILGENEHLKLTVGRNRQGHIVAKTFTPKRCAILGERFEQPIICITDKLRRFTTDGLIGLPFFMGRTVAFDFENNFLHIRE